MLVGGERREERGERLLEGEGEKRNTRDDNTRQQETKREKRGDLLSIKFLGEETDSG